MNDLKSALWIAKPIGSPTNANVVRGRSNVPAGDNFAWWNCHYEYVSNLTQESFTLAQLQTVYSLGFCQRELWDIIERDYRSEEVYTKSSNHPDYNTMSDHIVFDD